MSASPQTCHYKLIESLCVPAISECCRPCFYCVLVLPSQCLKGTGRKMNTRDGRSRTGIVSREGGKYRR